VLLVIAGILVMQTAWLLTVPPFRGSDEIDHAYRAASVARGEWVVGPTAEDGRGQLVVVPRSFVEAAGPQCAQLDYLGPDNCRAVDTEPDGSVRIATSAGVYHPAYYWLVGTVALPFEGTTALYAMRIAGALLCLLFLGLAAHALARLPGRWPLVAFALAATPVLVYSTIVVAPNGLEVAAGLCLWASMLALVRAEDAKGERQMLCIAIAAAAVMGTLRALGPVYVVLIVATIALLDWSKLWSVLRRHVRVTLAGALLVGGAAAGLAVWTASNSGYIDSDIGGSDPRPKFRPRNLLLWQFQSIAAFPLRNDVGPFIVYVVVVMLTLALLVAAFRAGTRREQTVLGVSVGTFVGFPVAFMLSPLGPDANFWQGRYMLPYGVGVLLIAGYVLAVRVGGKWLTRPLIYVGSATYAAGVGACWIKIRHDEITSNPASENDSAWLAPSPLLLAAIAVLLAYVLAKALLPSVDVGAEDDHVEVESAGAPGARIG
jgi:hypothetical protein